MKKNHLEIFNAFIQEHKSSENYLQRHTSPVITITDFRKYIADANATRLKAYLIQTLNTPVAIELSELYSATYKSTAQRLAVDQAILQLTKHGECGTLANGLIWRLLENGFPAAKRIEMDDSLHAYVVINDGKNEIALDPFFKLCCPYEEYAKQAEVLRYGKAVQQDPLWNPAKAKTVQVTYDQKAFQQHLSDLNHQVSRLMQFRNEPRIRILLEIMEYCLHLNEQNFNASQVTKYLRVCIPYTYTHAKKVSPKDMVTLMDCYLPMPSFQPPKFSPLQAQTLFNQNVPPELIEELTVIINQIGKGQIILKLISEQKYGSALRTAANDSEGFLFIQCLLKFKDVLRLDIQEQAGPKNLSAIDYAKKNPDTRIIQLLEGSYVEAEIVKNQMNKP